MTGQVPGFGTARSAAPAFRAGRALGWLGGFAVMGFGVSVLYATTGLGVACPFRTVTGWECPLCGGTRLGAALLHGDISAAFAYNPVVFVGLVVLAGFGLAWTVEALGGPRLRLTGRLATLLRRVHPTHWLVLGSVLAIGFVVVRNLF